MNKILLLVAGGLVLLVGGFFLLNNYIYQEKQADEQVATDPANASYVVEQQVVELVDGHAEEQIVNSASSVVTDMFGEPVYGDLDADGDNDAAVVLTQSSGGSGTFYYVAAAMQTENGYQGTNAVLLGDRIAPQTLELRNGVVIANYAGRLPEEPMTSIPSIAMTTYAMLEGEQLVEIAYHEDLVIVANPAPGEEISSPLVVSGKARGTWFFEGDFPLVLVDWDGRIIAESYATAQGEWMTEDYVPFEGTIEFETPEPISHIMNRGALILQKDNPSGLPEHDDALEISIQYQ